MDCQYCHTQVFDSRHANIPATQTCMNCHNQIETDNENLELVRQSWETGEPIEWIRVHMLPDYAYFNHSAHVIVGVGCESCHGRIDRMDVVRQEEPLSMSWCLDCYRETQIKLSPVSEVYSNGYQEENHVELRQEVFAILITNSPTYCQRCHF